MSGAADVPAGVADTAPAVVDVAAHGVTATDDADTTGFVPPMPSASVKVARYQYVPAAVASTHLRGLAPVAAEQPAAVHAPVAEGPRSKLVLPLELASPVKAADTVACPQVEPSIVTAPGAVQLFTTSVVVHGFVPVTPSGSEYATRKSKLAPQVSPAIVVAYGVAGWGLLVAAVVHVASVVSL